MTNQDESDLILAPASASIMYAFLSPGSPKTTDTPHSASFSAKRSAVVALASEDGFREIVGLGFCLILGRAKLISEDRGRGK